MKKFAMSLWVAVATAVVASSAWAEPVVSALSCKQRYPWNGKVDITFTVSGVTEAEVAADAAADMVTVLKLSSTNHADGAAAPLEMKSITDISGG